MRNQPNFAPPAAPEDERAIAANLRKTIDELKAIIDRETQLLRAGDIKGGAQLEPQKTEASRLYVAAAMHAQKAQRFMARLMPDVLKSLQDRHADLRSALQTNLTVLATAHAVSEAVVRGVNTEVQKRTMPQTYTAYGQRTAPTARNVVPIVVNRAS